jgi:Cof subfamily protein (haloacid dehalogenase superfamily)
MDIKPMQRDIKLIVIDVDGTLLNNEHKLSDRNRDVIKKAVAHGVRVVLATGKSRVSTENVIKELALDTPGVYLQGLMICNADGTVRKQTTMDKAPARRVISYAESNGFDVLAYSGNRLLAKHNGEPFSQLLKYGEAPPDVVGPLVNILDSTPINKLLIIGTDPRKLKALRWQLNQQVGEQVTLVSAAIENQLEVLPKGQSKANGVRLLLKDLGVALENVMAIGDAENDIDMLKMVGLGVAVGNASDEVKAAVKEVVSSNHDNGVAEAIEKFVLPKEEPKPTPPVEAAPEPKVEVKAETPAAPKAETPTEPKVETPVEKPADTKPEGSAE